MKCRKCGRPFKDQELVDRQRLECPNCGNAIRRKAAIASGVAIQPISKKAVGIGVIVQILAYLIIYVSIELFEMSTGNDWKFILSILSLAGLISTSFCGKLGFIGNGFAIGGFFLYALVSMGPMGVLIALLFHCTEPIGWLGGLALMQRYGSPP